MVFPRRRRDRFHLVYERRVLLFSLCSGLPGTALALWFLWTGGYALKVQWTVSVLVVGFWLGLAFSLRERVVRPFQTLSNLVAALREGDYSIRSRGGQHDDALGLAMREVNALGTTLRDQRLGALEATALLGKIMAEIDVAIFAFDGARRLQLVNRAGERLLAQPAERVLGLNAAELGLAQCLEGDVPRTLDVAFPGTPGRWEIRRSEFRQGGIPHQLLVLADVSRMLREQERVAWQRLVRVLGHEINNSLAPIKSIAATLQELLSRSAQTVDLDEDLRRGLNVISGRAEALGRFMSSYTPLARLPPPRMAVVYIETWVRRVAALETRLAVQVEAGPPMTIQADGDQLDQLLINLTRNATDASLETGGGVLVGWRRHDSELEVWIEDEGPGLSDTTNLFVPFFTTKPHGSGIGLVLSRQIAEAHGGTLTLDNRAQGGCRARLRLPIDHG